MKKFKKIISALICITFLCSIVLPNIVYAESKTSQLESIKIMTEEVPEEAYEAVREEAANHIQTFLQLGGSFKMDYKPDEPFYLGNGYYTYYTDQDGSIKRGDLIDFPVIQDSTIVLFIRAYYVDGAWECSASYAYKDELAEVSQTGLQYMVIAPDDQSEGMLVSMNLSRSSAGMNFSLEEVEVFPEDLYTNQNHYLGEITISVTPVQSRANGFYVNTNTYKQLNTDNCLVLQNDPNGNQRGLCWAATAATIIRYLTGNRTVESFLIADQLGIPYDQGGSVSDILRAMLNYGCTIQYQAVSRQPSSIVEIMHNINNQYPVAAVGTRATGSGYAGHAVTVVGYHLNNGEYFIYWNSANAQIITSPYKASGSHFLTGVNVYQWVNSVLIPL